VADTSATPADEMGVTMKIGRSMTEVVGQTTGSIRPACRQGLPLHGRDVDALAREKLATMSALGTELTIVPSVGGQITPDLTARTIETAGLA
jgi:cysteine synthase A